MKELYLKISIAILYLVSFCNIASAQTAATSVVFSGFQACGGCTVCGADYWCTNTPGSYCGNTVPCIQGSFIDPIPPGNVVTNVTILYYTASCYGSSIETSINGFNVPVTYDGSSGCLCSSLPCILTTAVTSSYPCGMPNYVYGGSNIFQVCSNGPMCINRADITLTYVKADVITPTISASGPLTICSGESVTLTANGGFANYNWSNGDNTQSITVSTPGTYTITGTSITGCVSGSASATVNINPTVVPSFNTLGPYCEGVTPDALPVTSNNGITGTWNPSSINTGALGTTSYTFTPNPNQCAQSINLDINVSQSTVPVFDPIPPFCEDNPAPVLPAVSNNGIPGTWNPPTISNTTSGNYTFTPTSGTCVNQTSLSTTVLPKSVTSLIYHD